MTSPSSTGNETFLSDDLGSGLRNIPVEPSEIGLPGCRGEASPYLMAHTSVLRCILPRLEIQVASEIGNCLS